MVGAVAGLRFVDDPSNATPRYARNRIRNEILPQLAEIGPEVERNIAATHAELHEEAALLASVVADALAAAGAGGDATAIAAAELEAMPAALRRLCLRELAERAAGRRVPLNRSHAARIVALAGRPQGGEVEIGGGLSAICETGTVRFATGSAPVPDAVRLSVPGVARFGEWELRAELRPAPIDPADSRFAALDAASVGGELEVRAWQAGDRMRPLGLGGSKSLQDLFTDRGVPRSVRTRLPVVTAGGRVAWVAGVAVSDEFRLLEESTEVAVITARPAAPRP
jgi:tRNA(Ile)-lysidine synthase